MPMIKGEIETKLLDQTDVDVFRRIRLEALEREPAAFASSYHDWLGLSESEWVRRLSHNIVFVAFRQSEPVGIMGLMRQKPSKMAHRASLIMVYVRKEERGTEVATNLFGMIVRTAAERGISQLELNASVENPAAIRFYQRMGFDEIGRIPAGFIHEGKEIDDILMVRRLGRA